jgi:DNA-binding MarR family transcriptional regulator
MAKRSLVLETFLPYRLSYTSSLVSELIAGAYKSMFGLTIPEWRVIAHAAEEAGVTQQQIGQRSRMDKVTVSRAAIALIDRGLIARAKNLSDRRSHQLMLTGAGRALYEQVAPKALELEARVFDRFDSRELAVLEKMLRKIDLSVLSTIAS